MNTPTHYCLWTPAEHGQHTTGCNRTYQFDVALLVTIDYRHCPGCGRAIARQVERTTTVVPSALTEAHKGG